jgi:hypothetical protein
MAPVHGSGSSLMFPLSEIDGQIHETLPQS